jgi:hypothetical protein
MATARSEVVRRLATALPQVEDRSTDKALSFYVGGNQFAWSWNERVDVKKPRVPRLDVLVVRCDGAAKAAILESDTAVFFTEPHFDGFPAVLVRLEAVDAKTLKGVLEAAWRCQAPKGLAK